MDFLAILAVAGVVAAAMFSKGGAPGFTTADSLAAMRPQDVLARVHAVIASRDLKGLSPAAVLLMADMENGFSAGMLTPFFRATNSLFNRHKGLGTVGVPNSDGYWTGRTYYATAADPDLRIYDSLEQSVDDFVQLMGLRIYASARAAAMRGDVGGFIAAIAAVPYSAQPDYFAALRNRARSLGLA